MNTNFLRNDMVLMAVFTVVVVTMPIWLAPIGAGYPDLLQKIAIFLDQCGVKDVMSLDDFIQTPFKAPYVQLTFYPKDRW